MDDSHSMPAASVSQADRSLGIDSALGPDALLLTRLDGEDAISRCFLYRVEVVATVQDASVEALLGEPVTLWLMNDDPATRRPIHGHVRSVAGLGHDFHEHRRFELEVVPRLWFLSCTCDCRIFQDLSVPDILHLVFTEQGLTDVAFRIVQDNYPKLDYCVQFEESTLDFVSRLMEHLGLFYWHEHAADRHVLVIGDRNDATSRCDPASVIVSPNPQRGEVQTLDFRSVFRPGKWTLNDYDFHSPTKRLLVDTPTTLEVPRMLSHEIYRWAGSYNQHDDGRMLSRIRMEMEEARHRVVSGTGHCPGFDPGRRVSLSIGRNDFDTTYLLTEVRHHATSPGLESDADSPDNLYTNEFAAILATTPFRPPLATPKPVMRGQQTATVVGPPGESIFCDPFGRVKVQFHWDRRGMRNERSSCWIRVAQSRAGSFYGSLSIPHVGHEVIVAFLEGDPDRPLITGSVPHALTMPPVELPREKHKTIHRDHADNRMIMQGKPGEEHLSLVSPRRVNMFAVRPGARSLSAHGLPTTFNDAVFEFTGDNLDPYKDPTGLYEVWESWYLLNNPKSTTIPLPPGGLPGFDGTTQDDLGSESGDILKITNPTPASTSYTASTSTTSTGSGSSSGTTTTSTTTTASSSSPVQPPAPGSTAPGTVTTTTTTTTNGNTKTTTTETDTAATTAFKASDSGQGVDMKAEECDINSFTAGRNNAVSLGNKNTWVWADNNTWVNQDSNSLIKGNSTSHIEGDAKSTIDGDSNSTIYGGATSMVYGYSVSGVFGDRASFTLGANETLVYGPNLSINFILAIGLTLGVNISYASTSINSTVTKIKAMEIEISTLTARLESTAAHLTTAENNIQTTAATLHDHGIEVHL